MPDFDVKIPIVSKNLTRGDFKQVGSQVDALTARVNKFNAVGQRMQSTGRQIAAVGRRMSIAGLAIGAAIGLMTSRAAIAESGLARVNTLIDERLVDTIGRFRSQLDQLSVKSGKNIKDLNNSLFNTISAGVSVGDSMKFMNIATKGAIAGFTDTNTIVEGLSRLYNAYGKNISKVPVYMDQIALANKYGVTTFEAIASNVGTVAGQFSALNIQSGELLAGLASLTKFTPSTEIAVTQLSALVTAIIKPSEEAIKTIDILNKKLPATQRIAFGVEALQQEGLVGFFKRLQNATQGNVRILNELFGTNVRAARAIFNLSQDAQNFISVADEMNQVTDQMTLTNAKYGEVQNTMTQRVARARQSIALIVREIGFAFFPVVEQLLTKLQSVLTPITAWIRANQALVGRIAVFVGILTGALVVFGPIITMIGSMVAGLGGLVVVIAGAVSVGGALIATVALIAGKILLVAPLVVSFFSGLVRGFLLGLTGADNFKEALSRLYLVFKMSIVPILKIFFTVIKQVLKALHFVGVVIGFIVGKVASLLMPDFEKLRALERRDMAGPKVIVHATPKAKNMFEKIESVGVREQVKADKLKTNLAKKAASSRVQAVLDELNRKKSATTAGGKAREIFDLFAPTARTLTGEEIQAVLASAGGPGFGTAAIAGAFRQMPAPQIRETHIDRVVVNKPTNVEEMIESIHRTADGMEFNFNENVPVIQAE